MVDHYDRAITLCREAGFKEIRLRGDTDFSLTAQFDRWDTDGVRFVFGYDARANLIERAQGTDDETYHELVTRAERQIATKARTRPRNVKDDIVRERNYKVLRQTAEDVVEFSYRPGNCKRDYRVVALRKNVSVERGENVLFCEYRYFFYITNDRDMTADEVIDQARQRCNQENLISQLKSGVRALHAPVNTLSANWAYMTMAALAWSLKAWCTLLLPVSPRWAERHNEQRRRVLTMDFRTFLAAFIEIPCQIITTGRRVRWRILAYNPWPGRSSACSTPSKPTATRITTTGQTGRRTSDPEQRSNRVVRHPPTPSTSPIAIRIIPQRPHNHVETSAGRSRPVNQPRTAGIACFRIKRANQVHGFAERLAWRALFHERLTAGKRGTTGVDGACWPMLAVAPAARRKLVRWPARTIASIASGTERPAISGSRSSRSSLVSSSRI